MDIRLPIEKLTYIDVAEDSWPKKYDIQWHNYYYVVCICDDLNNFVILKSRGGSGWYHADSWDRSKPTDEEVKLFYKLVKLSYV